MATPWRTMKPNKMFPEEMRWLLRGYVAAKGEKLPSCPACGKNRRKRWTMVCRFRAYSMGQFVITPAGEHDALTLVCDDHPLNPTRELMAAVLPGYIEKDDDKASEPKGGDDVD